jgi:6-phosphofructokinase
VADKKVAILVGGGPAPGINSVIGAATIRVSLSGAAVVGVRDGFKWIMEGDTSHITPLSIESVSRIHFRGGSVLGIARANPTKDEKKLENTVQALQSLGADRLITIGGDDTAFSAYKLQKKAAGRLRVVHVPKTIDNDLDLPQDVYTFGFQTARHVGVDIVKNLMVDAFTTSRWYFVIAMGRKAGHLALGIGKAAGATLTLIPEEFQEKKLRLSKLVDLLAVAILKRLSYGRPDGVAVLAEGLVEKIDEQDLEELSGVERDDHGHIRIAEIDFGDIVKRHVQKRLAEFKVKSTLIAKNIGYEVRCADPIPYDLEYTRDLGYCAAKYLIEGGDGAVVTMQGGHFKGIPFEEMMDPATGRTRVRMVDVDSTRYRIARRYMIRLRRDDFDSPEELEKLAKVAKLSTDDFRKTFEYLIADEPPRIRLHPEGA